MGQAFLAAAREGRFEQLLLVLHLEVQFTVHTPNGQFVTLGATKSPPAREWPAARHKDTRRSSTAATEALDVLRRARAAACAAGDAQQESRSLHNIGIVLEAAGRMGEALTT
ncbi:hypothetical protein [Streptomyces mutabilis]